MILADIRMFAAELLMRLALKFVDGRHPDADMFRRCAFTYAESSLKRQGVIQPLSPPGH